MTADALKEKIHAEPFEPFRLRMPDGRALSVPHPDFIFVAPNRRTVLLFKPDTDGGYWTIDLQSVSDLEPEPKKSGRRRSK